MADSLQDFLTAHGVNEQTSTEKVEELKQQFWLNYHREYRKNRKAKRKKITFEVSPQEKVFLEGKAAKNGMSMGRYCRESIMAYAHQKYMVPATGELERLMLEIRKIGVNINQSVKKINASKDGQSYEKSVMAMKEAVQFLQKKVHQELSEPPQLTDVIEAIFFSNPSEIAQIERILESVKAQQNSPQKEQK